MSRVFIINGKPTSGKDTFVNYVKDINLSERTGYQIINYSTIDYVKYVARQIGWNGEKQPKDREMLANLKQLLTKWNDSVYIQCTQFVRYSCGEDDIVFIHCREPQEIERLVKAFNAKTIYIDRDVDLSGITNSADLNVENYHYDYVIDNNQEKEDLWLAAKQFYEKVIGE